MEKKTPLYEEHVALGGKIVPFAGYLLPVQYGTGVIAEHMAVRTACGMFDVSHMGEVLFEGADALQNLNHMLTNRFDNMAEGQARYSVMCNEKGGCVDDLIVYKENETRYLVVVNAANKDKDVSWMQAHVSGDCKVTDVSDQYVQIALQGPKAEEIVSTLQGNGPLPEKYYHAVMDSAVGGIKAIVSKTGYTGEDGYEFYVDAADGVKLWRMLLDAGKDFGLIPCGLGARDTLRLEAAMPLYGHEMDDEISPLETGLSFAVKMDKEGFIGKAALEERGTPKVKRVGLKVTGRGIIREHATLTKDGKEVGHSTSGTHCPYLNTPLAMALIDADIAAAGGSLTADVRGRAVEAEIVPLPFYKKGMARP